MNKNTIVMFVMVALIGAGCSQQKEQSTVSTETVQQALESKDVAKAQAQTADESAKVAAQVQAMAQEKLNQIQGLLAQAKQLLNQGQFQEAINLAQQVLNMDPSNLEAKNLIETAKAKIAAMAQEKAGVLKTDLTNKLGSFGAK